MFTIFQPSHNPVSATSHARLVDFLSCQTEENSLLSTIHKQCQNVQLDNIIQYLYLYWCIILWKLYWCAAKKRQCQEWPNPGSLPNMTASALDTPSILGQEMVLWRLQEWATLEEAMQTNQSLNQNCSPSQLLGRTWCPGKAESSKNQRRIQMTRSPMKKTTILQWHHQAFSLNLFGLQLTSLACHQIISNPHKPIPSGTEPP